jgi:UDP-2-acetamido-2,6-beta-L-arabino-hexul-4-ose reductase
MRVLVTGSRGFIGKNLLVRLRERPDVQVSEFGRENSPDEVATLVGEVDAIVHLAGENRPKDLGEFERVNYGLTETLCDAIRHCGRSVPMILASSTQAAQVNPYGLSKRAAEAAVEKLVADTGNPAAIYRLPGVFGKWCRPNYNSVVATFCHNIANGLSIRIDDPATVVRLVYIDDVIADFMAVLQEKQGGMLRREVVPEYSITLGDLAEQIRAFGNCRSSLVSEPVGTGLVRALYST